MQLPLFKSDALNKVIEQVDQGYTFQLFKTETEYVAELFHDERPLPFVGYSSVDAMQALKRLFEMRSESHG